VRAYKLDAVLAARIREPSADYPVIETIRGLLTDTPLGDYGGKQSVGAPSRSAGKAERDNKRAAAPRIDRGAAARYSY